MTLRISLLIGLCMTTLTALAAPQHSSWPGGFAVIEIDGSARPIATFDGRPVMVLRQGTGWVAVVGIPLEQDVDEPLYISVTTDGGAEQEMSAQLMAADYRVQHLTVDRKYVEPDQASLERIFAERKVIDRALNNWRDNDIRDITFEAPVSGARSSSFGSRRVFNGQPRSPHKGMDMAAVSGTPILTPLDGIVTVTGDFYFNGNTVIVDHGQGLISLYCHLSEIGVAETDDVTTGQPLGKVGATGRVTGAHLHFAIYLNGTAVDPGLLLTSP